MIQVILANPEATKKNVRFVGQDMNRSFALKENQEGGEDKFKLAAMYVMQKVAFITTTAVYACHQSAARLKTTSFAILTDVAMTATACPKPSAPMSLTVCWVPKPSAVRRQPPTLSWTFTARQATWA